MQIYILDDASFIRLLCRYYSESVGHKVIGEGFDGLEGYEQIVKLQPDCVILDMALPNMSGEQILRQLEDFQPHIKILVLTSLDKDIVRSKISNIDSYEYLRKPFEAADLIKALSSLEKTMERKQHG
jgi:DNA-binding response OmpR family regulator